MGKYIEMSNQLNDIKDQIQSGELDIDQTIKKLQEASKLVVKLEHYLKQSENKLSEIKIDFPD